jgi:hypothetical protein
VQDPIKIIGVYVVDADGVGQLSKQLVADPRGDRQVLQIQRWGRRSVQIKIDGLLHEGTQFRLVLVVEADAFDAPTHHFMCGTVATLSPR